MAKHKERFSPARPQPGSRSIWSWEEFVFGLTGGAAAPGRGARGGRRRDRRY